MAKLFTPILQMQDGNGNPLSGARLSFFRAGTTTKVTTYHDAGATTPHTNPVIADAAGTFPDIYLVDGNYKFELKSSTGVTIKTVQRLVVSSLGVGGGYDVQVDTLADRDQFDDQAAGWSVLVSDVGDGRAAIYSKNSGSSGDWSDPAYVTGPAGIGEGGYGLPSGGSTGQVLAKASGSDGDAEWMDRPPARVASRAALKDLDITLDTVAILTEAGREGTFIWRSGDYSTQITADTAEGIYLKADAVATTSGAWVRAYDGGVDLRWFGDDPAAAFAFVAANALPLFIPAGVHEIAQAIEIDGYGLTAYGEGRDVSILKFTTTSGIKLTPASQQQVVDLRDFAITTTTTAATGVGLELDYTGATVTAERTSMCTLQSLSIRGFSYNSSRWLVGLKMTAVRSPRIYSVDFFGTFSYPMISGLHAIEFHGQCINPIVRSCGFVGFECAVKSFGSDVEGIQLYDLQAGLCQQGVNIMGLGNYIVNCHFSAFERGIYIYDATSCFIANNFCLCEDFGLTISETYIGIEVAKVAEDCLYNIIDGNHVHSLTARTDTGVKITGVNFATRLLNNHVTSCDTAYSLGTENYQANLFGNTYNNCTTGFTGGNNSVIRTEAPYQSTNSTYRPWEIWHGTEKSFSGEQGKAAVHGYGAVLPFLSLRRAKGTTTTPTVVANGDNIGQLDFAGYDGTNFSLGAYIRAIVTQATPDTNKMASYLSLAASATDSATPTEVMRLAAAAARINGGMGFNRAAPSTGGVALNRDPDNPFMLFSYGTAAAPTDIAQVRANGAAKYIGFANSTGATYMLAADATNNRVGINEVAPDYRLDVNGSFGFTPGSSVTPVDNGDVVFELTNNTTLTVKAKGSDGTVRSGTITLA